jgi:hypothetical protein
VGEKAQEHLSLIARVQSVEPLNSLGFLRREHLDIVQLGLREGELTLTVPRGAFNVGELLCVHLERRT